MAARAVELITDGARVGLGSGRAASAFITQLGDRVRQGLQVTAVPTSVVSARLAHAAGIPLIELGEEWELDLTVDGADEVAPNLDLLKGRGGAMVRERIVAAASKRLVILVGREKLVRVLGEHGPLPIEVIPFAVGPVVRMLKGLGLTPVVRMQSGLRLMSENGNVTLDSILPAPTGDRCMLGDLAAAILALPGVVDVGLVLDTAERVLVGHPDGRVETLMRGDP
ncbi:MAG: ribose-5-phosphate isomerase RpiA [Gemmatimonadales bacterium]